VHDVGTARVSNAQVDLQDPTSATADRVTELAHPISPHRLRHFLLTWLKKQGIDDALIQPYSGHASRKSLEIYSQLTARGMPTRARVARLSVDGPTAAVKAMNSENVSPLGRISLDCETPDVKELEIACEFVNPPSFVMHQPSPLLEYSSPTGLRLADRRMPAVSESFDEPPARPPRHLRPNPCSHRRRPPPAPRSKPRRRGEEWLRGSK
jgi:Phage integrase family